MTQIATTRNIWGDTFVDEKGTKDYRFLWFAKLMGFMFYNGESILGVTRYTTRIEDLEFGTNA